MPTYILGLSAFYHDGAACLVRDGEIVAGAQEERFTRKKFDARFPTNAVSRKQSAVRSEQSAVSSKQSAVSEHKTDGDQNRISRKCAGRRKQ